MGKREILGFVLIGLVLIVWMWVNTPTPPQPGMTPTDTGMVSRPQQPVAEPPAPVVKNEPKDTLGSHFAHLAVGREKVLTITTDLYTAEVSTRGGQLRKWELSRYKTWDGYQVQMVDPDHG